MLLLLVLHYTQILKTYSNHLLFQHITDYISPYQYKLLNYKKSVNKKQEDVPLTTSGCEWVTVKKLNPGLPMKTKSRLYIDSNLSVLLEKLELM